MLSLAPAPGLRQSGSRPEASRQAAEADAQAKDDAKCKENGLEPGTPAYDNCLVRALPKPAPTKPRRKSGRRIDFQKTLGAGTSGYSGP